MHVLTLTICVGSSCYLRGSDELAAALERLVTREALGDQVELVGAFCMEGCSTGVSIRVGDHPCCNVRPENAESFFFAKVMPQLEREGAA